MVVLKLEPVDSPVHHVPSLNTRPVRPALPWPSKSPTCTSTQVTRGDHVSQSLLVKDEPLDWATYHWPVCRMRPAMSILPLPMKSPTRISTHVTPVAQVVQALVVNDEPMDKLTHQIPVEGSRPAMSVLPSPLKSPVTTSVQLTAGFQVVKSELVKAVDPFDNPTYHCPVLDTRPMISLPKVATTLTLAVAEIPIVTESVTVTDCRPADLSVTVKVCIPLSAPGPVVKVYGVV